MDDKVVTLSEAEELLLSKYFDDECNILERSRVRRLIDRTPSAKEYLHVLEASQQLVRTSIQLESVTLWSRIGSRIHQEERSLLLAGKRKTSWRDTWMPFPSFVTYSAAGAGVATALFLFLPLHTSVSRRSTPIEITRSNPNSRSFVPTAVDVHWMRSSGKVTVMPGSGKAPVIFIKRRQPSLREVNSRGIIMSKESIISSDVK